MMHGREGLPLALISIEWPLGDRGEVPHQEVLLLARGAWARLSVAVVFFVNGAIFATWTSRIPAITTRLSMGSGTLAFAVFGLSVGAVVGLPISSALVARFGTVPVVRVTLPGYALALAGVALASNVPALTAALIGLGIGNGVLDVAMNAAAVEVERRYPRQIMSAFHALFSFGGLAGALVGAAAAGIGTSTVVHLPTAALVLLTGALVASVGLLPSSPQRETAPASTRFAFFRLDRRLAALGLLVFCSLLCEGAVYDWSAVYLRNDLGGSSAAAALGFAAFSLSMACGRLVADRVVAQVGPVLFVRAAGMLAAVALGLILLGSSVAGGIAGFGLLGLSLAGVVPTLFSGAAGGGNVPATAIAVVSTIGYLGFLAGPALIGGIATSTSLRVALCTLVALTMVISAGAGALRLDPAVR
jgi:predicted MFS family arabinose efflux permease